MNGDVGEVLMFNKSLSGAEISGVESYLTTKWGI
jgi:hypothetical protein